MERFFKLLYYYLLGGLVLFVVYLTTMLAVSPKKDALKRGFIPCTEVFIQNIGECERGQTGCLLKQLSGDMKCNVSVIFEGLGAWAKGEQKTPWANYLFEPVAQAELDKELPYEGSVAADMNELEQQRLFIEQKHSELEEAKSREMQFDKDVLLSHPEKDGDAENMNISDDEAEEYQPTAEESDISAEAAISDMVVEKENVEEKNVKEECEGEVENGQGK